MSDENSIIIDLKFGRAEVSSALMAAFPGRAVIDLGNPAEAGRDLSKAAYAVVWKPDPQIFRKAPGLKVIFSGGAGVDHVMAIPGLPDLPVVRFVDRSLTDRMSEWVVWQCLHHLRHGLAYARQQRAHDWNEIAGQPEASAVTVGVMGLGVLGADAARKLKVMGFDVVGWSRRKKELAGIETHDASTLHAFLNKTDILVGLLPLTAETRGLFNRELFAMLKRDGALGGPIFLNAGRGGSQVEEDLMACLKDGTLKAASLDVFEQEPLTAESPLWAMENVVITPHAAAVSEVSALFRHVGQQIARHEAGQPLEHVVDRLIGY